MEPFDRFCESCGSAAIKDDEGQARREEDLETIAAISDRGRVRQRNEDAFSIFRVHDCQAAIVCDGVASTEASGAAATVTTEVVMEHIRLGLADRGSWTEILTGGIVAAQQTLSRDFAGATTIVAALAEPGRVAVANVGDSRAYWIDREGDGRVLTTDDSWIREAIARGLPEEMALKSNRTHEITAWLGADAWTVVPHLAEYEPAGDGLLVLSSDGFWNYAESAGSIAALLHGTGHGPLGLARTLVAYALESGGADNITVSVAEVRAQSAGNGKRTSHSRR